ncbi:MAG: type I-C CRISPR-associated protein Cas7/Csd2 [Muribaculaceae bacterium]|nr:type I-C CRISPR-associated protein Cas7/Csd2 [Muribaculaceae bacterium]
MSQIENRIDFVYIFDVQDGNPNGDPDAANLPRVDAETGNGLITDVCLKRKIRNYVDVAKKGEPNYDIFIQEAAVLDNRVEEIYKTDAVKRADKANQKDAAKQALCDRYYDIRAFGAVIATKDKQGQVRGPIQLTFGRSVDPVVSINHAITRMAVTKESDKDKERTMGRKATVPYGLYVAHGFVNANLANQTGFNQDDLQLLWDALTNMFDNDRSAARGMMAARKLIVFEHSSKLGNAPAHKLFDLIDVHKKADVDSPRSFADYEVIINKENLPKGVTVKEII